MSEAYDEYANVSSIRIPPHSLEAEQAVLGGVLLNGPSWFEIAGEVNEADFYRGDHRLIWRAIAGLLEDDSPADVFTVARALENSGAAGRGVDVHYLAELAESAPGVANLKAYAKVIRERADLRRTLDAANRIADSAFNPEGRKASEVIAQAQSEVLALGLESAEPTAKDMRAAMRDLVEDIDARINGGTTGLEMGRRDFDRRHEGFEPQELIILAARPAMGKSLVAMDWAVNVAAAGGRVHVFSLEMSSRELTRRIAARVARVPGPTLRSGRLGEDDWPRLTAATAKIKNLPLTIDDSGGLHINQIRARARAAHMRNPLSLIVVDYLQLVEGDGRSILEATTHVSKSLKALAMELRIPVVALSQLNRAAEQRQNKRPVLSDLRESGSIEQDGDRVVALYRADAYDENSPRKGVLELITLKFRAGEIGTDYCLTDLAHSTINDTPEGWTLPPETVAQPQPFARKRDL